MELENVKIVRTYADFLFYDEDNLFGLVFYVILDHQISFSNYINLEFFECDEIKEKQYAFVLREEKRRILKPEIAFDRDIRNELTTIFRTLAKMKNYFEILRQALNLEYCWVFKLMKDVAKETDAGRLFVESLENF